MGGRRDPRVIRLMSKWAIYILSRARFLAQPFFALRDQYDQRPDRRAHTKHQLGACQLVSVVLYGAIDELFPCEGACVRECVFVSGGLGKLFRSSKKMLRCFR